ncbi:MAG: tRNA pseudouridine(55) synthase TruB [Oscillospiraceae bacterium]|nr:tRNA pseudouridine(55) synthase TruB [Oscillospiraceae bacterium]
MNGILLIDKPAGWTSSDVVAKLRGVLHERRIGHSGTLDPMATGLLVVFVGRGTRAVEFAESHEKRYLASLRPGLVTDTQDVTGTPIGGSPRALSDAELEDALRRFRGEIDQIPPMYSAIKVKGQKLYEIARRGGEVERKPRRVRIAELRLLGRDGEDVLLDVRCSKGTYIRTLCHDIGQALGCGACMSALRRLEAGDFSLEDAYTLEQVQRAADEGRAEELLLPVDRLFAAYPALCLSAAEERRLRVGAALSRPEAAGEYRVYAPDGAFLALGRLRDGDLRSIKSFFEVTT